MEVLVGAADADGGVFEDEFGVALGREGSDEVELALGEFDQAFLGARSEDVFADWGELAWVQVDSLYLAEIRASAREQPKRRGHAIASSVPLSCSVPMGLDVGVTYHFAERT